MNNFFCFLCVLSISFTAACTNQQVYEEVQRNQRMKCAEEPASMNEKCLEQFSKPYEVYERQFEELSRK